MYRVQQKYLTVFARVRREEGASEEGANVVIEFNMASPRRSVRCRSRALNISYRTCRQILHLDL